MVWVRDMLWWLGLVVRVRVAVRVVLWLALLGKVRVMLWWLG